MTKALAPTFPVVGIGGSAGGLLAFFAFFAALEQLEEPPGMAFIVVLHLAPDQESQLTDLLATRTRLPVRLVEVPMAVEIDTVYVIPPDRTLVVERGMVVPRDQVKIGSHHPVDDLFQSLALSYGDRAVGIVCSGTGSNGSLGAAAIREAGGWVLAQSLDTAKFGEMPRRAIETGMVDAVLAPEAMIAVLCENARRLAARSVDTGPTGSGAGAEAAEQEAAAAADAAPPDPMKRVLTMLRARANMDFRPYKPGMLSRRIERRQQIRGHADLSAYVDELTGRPEEVAALVDDLLITVKGFFRDPTAWDVLARKVGPMFASRHEEPLRAWIAGCATGEEAYSVAIMLSEAAFATGAERPIEIFATDASQRALSRARQGVYPRASIESLSPERQQRWFTTDDDTVRVKPELREAMIFAPQNLLQDPPFSRADLVVCRNVLIYLQADVQRRLMRLFHFALKEDGILFLGGAEGIGDAADLFEVVDKAARIYHRMGPTRHDLVDFPVVRARRSPETILMAALPRPLLHHTRDRALKALADRYAPPSVLVDQAFNVLYYQGATDRHLRPQSGEPTHSLLALAREGLALHLRRVAEAAKQSGETATVRVRATLDGEPVHLTIEAVPVPAALDRAMIVVSFVEDASPPVRVDAVDPLPFTSRERELEAEVEMLRQETARAAMARWVTDYNKSRPHSALGYRTPAAYAAHLTAMGDRFRVTVALHRSPIAPPAQQRQSQPPTPGSNG
jgi:two-component system CheB/CheR fusion protein